MPKNFDRCKIGIVGCMGVPAKYGGFETLAENLVKYHADKITDLELTVYCSSTAYQKKNASFMSAKLYYVPLNANGSQSIFYDMWSIVHATLSGAKVILLLGHGGSFIIPIIKLFFNVQFVTNIDGIEWKREKWSTLARWVLRKSEIMAIRYSDKIIADNEGIEDYVSENFDKSCSLIEYGGDHALDYTESSKEISYLPKNYFLALCRIEPENNVHLILEAFSKIDSHIVFIGNWDHSEYGRKLKQNFSSYQNIHLHEPVYEAGFLGKIRKNAKAYVHGHSAGGTNPALVEMMHFGIPVLAYGCSFNRYTTEHKAIYFESANDLADILENFCPKSSHIIGVNLQEIASRRYQWGTIAKKYFDTVRALIDTVEEK